MKGLKIKVYRDYSAVWHRLTIAFHVFMIAFVFLFFVGKQSGMLYAWQYGPMAYTFYGVVVCVIIYLCSLFVTWAITGRWFYGWIKLKNKRW